MTQLRQDEQDYVEEISSDAPQPTYGGWCVEGEFGIQNLRYRQLERRPLRSDEVRVTLTHSALNYRDLMMVDGRYNPRQPLPLVPCSDGVGVISEVGTECRLKIGQRVIPIFSQGWLDGEPTKRVVATTLGGPLDGTLCREGVFSEEGVVIAPDYLLDEEAATLGCAGLTAWSALIELGQIKAGDHILCIGTGGVSVFAAQLAALSGARVTLTSRSSAKLDTVMSHPHFAPLAQSVSPMQLSSDSGWGREVRRRFGQVDHVIEVGGAGTLTESLSAVRPGGTISLIGVLAGGAAQVNLTPILMRQIRVQGVIVGHRSGFVRMLRALEQSQIRPVISSRFTLAQAPDAFHYLKSARHVGKIVLTHEV